MPKQEIVDLKIASGSTLEQAAKSANVGTTTVKAWKEKCPEFVARVQEIRDEISKAVIDSLKDGMLKATNLFKEMVDKGETSHIRMKAAEALMVHGIAVTEMVNLKERIAALEERAGGGTTIHNHVIAGAASKVGG
jgi:hypothetical protein